MGANSVRGLLVGIGFLLLTIVEVWGACVFQEEVCVDSGCKTFTQGGTSFQICKPCWRWEKRYVCSDGGVANYCQTYENDPSRYQLVSKTCILDRYGLGCEIEERVYRETLIPNASCGDYIGETCVQTQDITFNEVQPPYTLTGVCTEKEKKYYCITSSTDYCQPYRSGCSQSGAGTCTKQVNGLCKLVAYNFVCGQAPQGCQKTGETCIDNSTRTIGDETITACWTYQYQYNCPTGTTVNTCTPYENNPDCTLVSENCSGTSCDRTYRCLIEETTGCSERQQRTVCSGEDICDPNSSIYNPDICNPTQVDMSQYFGNVAYLYALNEIRKDYACAGDLQTSTATTSTTSTSYVCSDYSTPCGTGTAWVCQSSPNQTNLSTDGTIEYCIQQGGNWVCPYRNEPCVQANIYTCPDNGYCYVMETTQETQNTTDLTYPDQPQDVGCLDSSYCADVASGSRNVSTPNYGGSCEIRVFSGMGYKCRRSGTETGFTNCCSGGTGDAWGIGGDPCNDEEKTLAQKREQSMCYYIGTYCSRKIKGLGFSVCLQKKESWCCFNSKLARIIHEQVRPQLGIGWGSAEYPNCRGFTLEELARIDWTAIDFSEFTADIIANVDLDVNSFNMNPNDPNAPGGTLLNLTQDYYQNLGGSQ